MRADEKPGYMQPRRSKDSNLVVVVVGPRTITSRVLVWGVLDRAHRHKPIGTIVHGGTPGVEQLAGEWATRIGLHVEVCPGEWARDEETAVLRRNGRMLQYHPDGVIIFPGTILGNDLAARAGAERIAVWQPKVKPR